MKRKLATLAPLLFKHRLTEMTIFVTAACNMTCDHCFVIDELNKKSNPLSVDELKKMAPHIPAMQRVHLSGGEPFIRPDLPEFAITISNEWNAGVVCIPTNGWYTKQTVKLIEEFGQRAKGNLRIHFSIHSPHAQDMDEFVHKKGAFARWRETVKAASEASAKYKNVTLIALAPYGEHNQELFPDLVKFVLEETEVDEFSFHPTRSHGEYRPNLDTTNYRKTLSEYFENDYIGSPLMRAYRQMVREEHLKVVEDSEMEPTCAAGTLRVVVCPYGNVYPCEMRGFPNGEDRDYWKLGNLREMDYDLPSLLKTDHAKARVKEIRDGTCICNHELDTALGLLSDPGFQVRLLGRSARYAFKKQPKRRSKTREEAS